MDVNYLNARDKISSLKSYLEGMLDKADYKSSMENRSCYSEIERLTEELDDVIRSIEYYSRPVEEGRLIELSNGRFEICDRELHSGSALEVYDEEESEWVAGRVEHRRGSDGEGYYFYGLDNKPFLFEGMKARIRVKR
jgi:hypothetical protein